MTHSKLTPLMRPVLISGPFVSRAMPIGLYWMLPGSKLSQAVRTFLMVSAWYYRKVGHTLKYRQKENTEQATELHVYSFLMTHVT